VKKVSTIVVVAFFFGSVVVKKVSTIVVITFFFGSVVVKKAMTIVAIAFFFGFITAKKVTVAIVIAFFFVYVAVKKAMVVFIIAFFFKSVARKKEMATSYFTFSLNFCYSEVSDGSCCHRLLLWICCSEKGGASKLSSPSSFWFYCNKKATLLRSPPLLANDLMASRVDLACVFWLAATLCECGSVAAMNAEMCEGVYVGQPMAGDVAMEQPVILGLGSPWQAAAAKMDALPAQQVIDRERLAPGVCMLDN